MEISSNMGVLNQTQNSGALKSLYTEKLSKDEVKELRAQIEESINKFTFDSLSFQSEVTGKDVAQLQYEEFQGFLQEIGYDGKPIAELSQDEASALIADDGFFGVAQTSERMANFVINGANGDEDKMRAGREGMLLGFKQAEEMWGGELPEISQETMKAALEMVDKSMAEQGFSILNTQA
jgi:hypothetical protein